MNAEASGIDPRILDRHVDVETGEITGRRMFGDEGRAGSTWPHRSGGPLPDLSRIPPDLNIGNAQDEIDAWAHEHDKATTALEVARTERSSVQIEVMKARMKYRRMARANPVERGRRTSDDIRDEVDEALAIDPGYIRLEQLNVEVEIQLGRLFRARDNQHRLDAYIKSLPRTSEYRP